jgi:peptidoglycan/LPS O-acetylase OafA/YrhL
LVTALRRLMTADHSLKKWEIKPSTNRHFDALDGLRGLAILLVVAYHTLYTNPAHGVLSRAAGYVIRAGWMGVPVFFVLSGFLISYPFFKGREADARFCYPQGYARRRFGKILPPFYLSILLFVGFYWWQLHDAAYVTAAWRWATGAANFSPIPVPFNLSYWSLIVEAQFYFVLPLLFWLTRGLPTRTTTIVVFALLALVPPAVRHFVWPSGVYVLPPSPADLHLDVMLRLTRFPGQLDHFAWGIAFAGVYVQLTKAGQDLRALSIFGYAGLMLMSATLFFWGYWGERFGVAAQPTRWSVEFGHLLPPVAAMLLLFFVFDPVCCGARLLSVRWLRFIGLVSYEWFLFHGPIVGWFSEHTGPTHGSIVAYAWRTFVPLILTFGFSVAVYHWISLPILNRIRSSLKRSPVHG